jgi:hypothetical protein
MIPAYVPSLNRAAQCDFLLHSADCFAPGLFDFTIFCKATTDAYREGYKKLAGKYKNVNFVGEGDFAEDMIWHLKDTIDQYPTDLWAIFTDDTIFYRDVPKDAYSKIFVEMDNPEVFSFTLRLGTNVNVQNYQTGEHLAWPQDAQLRQLIQTYKWNFKNRYCYDNFGYSFNCDGTVYKATDILALATNKTLFPANFKNLRGLEGKISHHDARHLIPGQYACCFPQSICTNISVNEVTDDAVPAGKYYPLSLEEANAKFLDGYILDYKIDRDSVHSCHTEVPYEFRRI